MLRVIFPVLSCLQIFVWGCMYSYPIWIPVFKSRLGLSQAVIDIAGSFVYVGAFIGMISAPFLLRALSLYAYGMVMCISATAGYGILFFMLELGGTSAAYTPLIVIGIGLIAASTGLEYSFLVGSMLQVYPERSTFINAGTNLVYALGAVGCSLIYLYTSIDVTALLMGMFIAHGAVGLLGGFVVPFSLRRLKDQDNERKPLLEGQPKQDEPLSGMAFLRSLLSASESWLVILILFFKLGVGASFGTNIGNLTESLDGDQHRVGEISLYYAISQTIGRALCTILTIQNQWDPTLWITGFISLVYCFLLGAIGATVTSESLPYFVWAFGVAYGSMWCVNGMLFRFTNRPEPVYFSNILAITGPLGGVGTLICNVVVGTLYDSHTDTHVCYGRKCYAEGLYFLSAIGFVVLILTIALAIRTSTKPKTEPQNIQDAPVH